MKISNTAFKMLWGNGDEKLQNPFNVLTDYSVKKPKSALLICLLLVFLLMPNAMFINFDNSEDAFFPDNETVSFSMMLRMNIKQK